MVATTFNRQSETVDDPNVGVMSHSIGNASAAYIPVRNARWERSVPAMSTAVDMALSGVAGVLRLLCRVGRTLAMAAAP